MLKFAVRHRQNCCRGFVGIRSINRLTTLPLTRKSSTHFSPLISVQKRSFQNSPEAAQVESKPQPIYLKDYKVPTHLVHSVSLNFDLGKIQNDEEFCEVTSKLEVGPNPLSDSSNGLTLKGGSPKEMTLCSIILNGRELNSDEYLRTEKELQILNTPSSPFVLDIKVRYQF